MEKITPQRRIETTPTKQLPGQIREKKSIETSILPNDSAVLPRPERASLGEANQLLNDILSNRESSSTTGERALVSAHGAGSLTESKVLDLLSDE